MQVIKAWICRAPSDEKRNLRTDRLSMTCASLRVAGLGEPEEIARCVVFLASDDTGFITGSTLSANGGQVMM